MRFLAAASSGLRRVLAGPPRPAECLGVARGALYLRCDESPGALAVLCHDAVRLPCGLLLPVTSAQLPLTSVAAASAGFIVGDHAVRWTGPAGPVVVPAVREWAPARPARGGKANASALAAVRSCLALGGSSCGDRRHQAADGCRFAIARAVANFHPRPAEGVHADAGARLLALLAPAGGDRGAHAAAAGLLGRGEGLTPAGDDVLAGFLVGAAAFGIDAGALRDATTALAPARTTALSAALLWHAARGECIDEVAALAAVLASQPPCRPEQAEYAVHRLLSVGHSSGAALALGLVTAAESALSDQPVLANTAGAA